MEREGRTAWEAAGVGGMGLAGPGVLVVLPRCLVGDQRAQAAAEVNAVVARADGDGTGVGDNMEVRRRHAG